MFNVNRTRGGRSRLTLNVRREHGPFVSRFLNTRDVCKARLCNTRNTVWRRDVIGLDVSRHARIYTIDSPSPDKFHENRSTRSSRKASGMDVIWVSPWLSSYARGVSFSRQLYTQDPLSRASRQSELKRSPPLTIREMPGSTYHLGIFIDHEGREGRLVYIRTIRKVSPRQEIVICRYTRANIS